MEFGGPINRRVERLASKRLKKVERVWTKMKAQQFNSPRNEIGEMASADLPSEES